MKNIIALILFLVIVLLANAVPLGKIRFINGEVWYRDNLNKPYGKTVLGANVNGEGFIKTGLDSNAEITWNNSMVSTIAANRETSVSKLWEEEKSKPTFKNRLLENIHNLRLQNNRRASSEAGIRREEAQVEEDPDLFWASEEAPSLEDAITLYDAKDMKKAIIAFNKIIEFGPLAKEAEMAHGFLILIYDETGDKQKALQEINTLKGDFPESPILEQTTE